MKRYLILFLLILILPKEIFSQNDPKALAVLDAMNAKVKSMGSLNITFDQNMTNKRIGINEEFSGKVVIKNDKYVLNIGSQEVYNDGDNIYSYNEEMNEITINVNNPDDEIQEELNINNIFDLYKSGFKYILLSEMPNGDRIIDLDPKNREKSFYKIRLIINEKNDIKSFTMFEKNGNVYKYNIKSISKVLVNDDYFTFEPSEYPDVEVIDFR